METTDINEDLLRHFVLNSLRSYRSKFSGKYGELVIACDDTDNWRKAIFPYYKASRKKDRKESPLDWNKIYAALNTIREEIQENFPYRVIKVHTAEADDVIGTLVMKLHNTGEKILIVSGDKDFKQLQRYLNVDQYNPVMSKMLKEKDPVAYLKEHIIRGDKGDGVPNYLSDDDCLVAPNKRQKAIRQAKLDVWLKQEPEEFCEDEKILKQYERNKKLVDLTQIPEHVQERIMEEYHNESGKDRSKIRKFFMEKRLKRLADDMTAF
tara:strand:- start:859 stop:1656 length:798 start_codon:yes stop_codon:yes gene_type:complete